MLKWLLIGGGITGAGIAGFLGYRKWSSSEQKRIDTLIAKLVQEQAEEDNKPEGWTPPVEPVTGLVEPDLRPLAPIVALVVPEPPAPVETPQPRKERVLGQVARYRLHLDAILARADADLVVRRAFQAAYERARIPQEVRESYEKDFHRPLTEREAQAIRDRHDQRRLALVALKESIPEAMVTRTPPLPEERVVEALRRLHPVQLCECDRDNCKHGQVRKQA